MYVLIVAISRSQAVISSSRLPTSITSFLDREPDRLALDLTEQVMTLYWTTDPERAKCGHPPSSLTRASACPGRCSR